MAGIDFELLDCYCEADCNHSGLGFMQLENKNHVLFLN